MNDPTPATYPWAGFPHSSTSTPPPSAQGRVRSSTQPTTPSLFPPRRPFSPPTTLTPSIQILWPHQIQTRRVQRLIHIPHKAHRPMDSPLQREHIFSYGSQIISVFLCLQIARRSVRDQHLRRCCRPTWTNFTLHSV